MRDRERASAKRLRKRALSVETWENDKREGGHQLREGERKGWSSTERMIERCRERVQRDLKKWERIP